MDKDSARKLIAIVSADMKRPASLTIQDFINVISFRRKMLPPDVVRKFVEVATAEGLLAKKGDAYSPNFSTGGVVVPLDFTVDEKTLFSSNADKPIIDRILDAAAASGKMTKKEAITRARSLMENTKYLSFQTVLLSVLVDENIDVSDFIREIEEKKNYTS
ncbi:DUF2240 domain-containing protein [Thermoplasma sp. Kam2015]|uniref:DUF2240 family protein n=1 Tax=Thermoplasma sp. Kam2015 TaxID=2094122 RepID=UPI000D8D5976|nr:DUF2240 family protein [Thermoplasma sp. Kam2015]PYB68858.1 DUF2240 domain-containing protein [Thermoplasma sp. Kam2015]